MEKTYKGGDVTLIQMYLEGKELQYRTPSTDSWVDITYKYKKPLDIYRVSNNLYTFREKPQVITKVYMHYDSMEELVQNGTFYLRQPENIMFTNPKGMSNYLEFTFTNGKLTKVEMKK